MIVPETACMHSLRYIPPSSIDRGTTPVAHGYHMDETNGGGSTCFEILTGPYRSKSAEWMLLRGDRGIIALGIALVFGAFFMALVFFGAVPLDNMQAILPIYSGLIVGNLTLVTVVVSINQLLLARELQTPGELEAQIEEVVEYREEVEEATGKIAPVFPSDFLRYLVEATREEAQRLGGFARGGVVTSGNEEIEEVVMTLTDQMDQIDTLLTESDTDTFSVLSVMLETNYARQINRLRTIRAEHEADIADTAHQSIRDLIDRLQEIDVAREYFRSIYLQQELSSLSRALLFTGLPAEAVAIATLLVLTVSPSGPTPMILLQVLVPITITIGLVPLAILCSFFLRTATVMKHTAATLPFTTPEQERL